MQKTVLEFGARGDGVHDDFSAFQAALDSGAETILIPQGIYPVSGTLKVGSNTTIIADRGAKIWMKSDRRRKRNEFLLSNADTKNGNQNICISGGIWDGNNSAPENAKPDLFDKEGYSGSLLNFVQVEGLQLRNMVLANSVTFYVRLARVRNFVIENIDFVCDHFGVNQDGLHFGGGVKSGKVRNIRALSYGQTNDDMIALNADDSIERVENLDLCRDTIEDITFDGIYTENCHTIVRMLSITAAIRNIHFRNVYGGFRCYGVNADAARYCRTPLFREEEYPQGVGCIEHVTFENFACYPVTEVPEGFGGTMAGPHAAICLESHADDFHVSGFRYLASEPLQQTYPAVFIRNLTNQAVCADGNTYELKNKADELRLGSFERLSLSKIR